MNVWRRPTKSFGFALKTFELGFRPRALKDWQKLDKSIRTRFQKKLVERLVSPRVPAAKLRRMPDCYRIKLSSVGFRLVYRVEDELVLVIVVAVGSREDDEVYDKAKAELAQMGD